MIEKQKLAEEERKNRHMTVMDLFRRPTIRKNTLINLLSWALVATQFDAYLRNIVNLRFSIYTTFTVSTLLELPADLLVIWGMNWFGRRWSAAIPQLLASICSLICALCIDNYLIVVVSALAARFFITYAINVGYQINFEIMPTELRGQGAALIYTVGLAATMASPVIVHSVMYNSELIWLLNP